MIGEIVTLTYRIVSPAHKALLLVCLFYQQDLSMQSLLFWNSIYRLDWPPVQRSTGSISHAGIKGMSAASTQGTLDEAPIFMTSAPILPLPRAPSV